MKLRLNKFTLNLYYENQIIYVLGNDLYLNTHIPTIY